MLSPRPLLDAVLSAIALLGCAAPRPPTEGLVDGGPAAPDAGATAPPDAGLDGRPAVDAAADDGCAAPQIEAWIGTAGRTSAMYPDDIDVSVTWQRVASTGCVDRYAPRGIARYRFAVPGALCGQTVAPASAAIAADHGTLTIDRSTSPATYVGSAATAWPVTWTCTFPDGGTETRTFAGGGAWFVAVGTVVGDQLVGGRLQPDGLQCGLGQSTLPCTYAWSFVATI